MSRRQVIGFIVLSLLVIVLALLRMLVFRDPNTGALEWSWPAETVARYRWTPLLVGACIGAALAVSGVVYQVLLRNPLASPFILGISNGAALGVVFAMYIGYITGSTWLREGNNAPAALIGALAVTAIVYSMGQKRGLLDPLSLILVGVIVSTICGAGIMLFQHLVPQGLRLDLTVWIMGHLPEAVKPELLWLSICISLAGVVIATMMGRAMDAATLGDDEARSIGLRLGSVRLGLFTLAAALAAGAVALAGPIGFVGLIAPHAARLILGPRHRPLVIGSALCGMVLVVGSDVARQVLTVGLSRVPIGVFTALIGGPAFIWLLKTGRGQV